MCAAVMVAAGVVVTPTPVSAVALQPGIDQVVVLGDSFSAGVGTLKDSIKPDDVDCGDVNLSTAPGARIARDYGASLEFYACGGSGIGATRRQWSRAERQIAGDGTGTLIVLSTGGNSVRSSDGSDWPTIVKRCSTWRNCQDDTKNKITNFVGIRTGMTSMLRMITTDKPGAIVRVMGYPELMQRTPDCWGAFGIERREADFADRNVRTLNQMIRWSTYSFEPNVQFVDVTDAFAGHGACETGGRQYVNGVVGPLWDPAANSYHPTAGGYEAYYQTLRVSLAWTPNLTITTCFANCGN